MKAKMYLWRGRCVYEGEDAFMKGKMYLWRGRCIYEGEDVFIKGKMYLWRGRCIYEGEDVFMKGKMYLWRGRCIYEGEDVFIKGKMYLWRGRCIHEGEDVFMKGKMYLWSEDVFMKGKMYLWRGRCIYEGKMYLWREKKNPGIFEEIENKMLFKNQGNPWNFSSQTYIYKFREFLKEKSERNVWVSVLAKNPGFFEPFATARFYNSKGKRRCADYRFVTDTIRAQISIKKSRIFMRNGKGKPPMEIPHTICAIRRYRFYGIIIFCRI